MSGLWTRPAQSRIPRMPMSLWRWTGWSTSSRSVAFLHLSTMLDYDALCAQLPDFVRPLYDGLVIEVPDNDHSDATR